MIKSMTGYGKSGYQAADRTVNLEVRSLNGKNLDINLKTPGIYKGREQEIRSLIGKLAVRGKIELIITVEGFNTSSYSLNKPLMEKYHQELMEFASKTGTETPVSDLIAALLRLPEVVRQQPEEVGEQEWELLFQALAEAMESCNIYRITEGKVLENDMRSRAGIIGDLLESVRPLEKKRTENVRSKLLKSLESIGDLQQADPNRFEQELLYYLEKLDITEELVRLNQHLEYFTSTLDEEPPQGKKLGFIAQEIGREINTIGSKANDADIQKIVVQMKDELEKIKEQLMNVL